MSRSHYHFADVFEALKKIFEYRCVDCGRREGESYVTKQGKERVIELTRGHIFIPSRDDGAIELWNSQPLCSTCQGTNSKKNPERDFREEFLAGWLNKFVAILGADTAAVLHGTWVPHPTENEARVSYPSTASQAAKNAADTRWHGSPDSASSNTLVMTQHSAISLVKRAIIFAWNTYRFPAPLSYKNFNRREQLVEIAMMHGEERFRAMAKAFLDAKQATTWKEGDDAWQQFCDAPFLWLDKAAKKAEQDAARQRKLEELRTRADTPTVTHVISPEEQAKRDERGKQAAELYERRKFERDRAALMHEWEELRERIIFFKGERRKIDEDFFNTVWYDLRNIDRDHPERTVQECYEALAPLAPEIEKQKDIVKFFADHATPPPPQEDDDWAELNSEEEYIQRSMSNDDDDAEL